MPSSSRPALAGLTACLALVAACSSAASGPPAPAASVGQRLDTPLPAAVRDTVLVTSTGQRLTLDSLAGKTLVISDMMTLCQETCPLDTANLVAATQAVQRAGLGDKVEFLSITIDPQRDSPQRLAAYRHLYAPAPADWQVATGTSEQLSALWKALGVYIQRVPDTPPAPRDWLTGKPLTYDLTHSDEVFLIDQDRHERFLLEGAPHVAPDAPIPATLKKFLDDTGHDNLTHPDAQAWTLPQELQAISWLTRHQVTNQASQ